MKFHLFVANRVQDIHKADDALRDQTVQEFVKNDGWLSGQKFLLQSSVNWDTREM